MAENKGPPEPLTKKGTIIVKPDQPLEFTNIADVAAPGFLTLKEHNEYAAEICVMAVRPEAHRQSLILQPHTLMSLFSYPWKSLSFAARRRPLGFTSLFLMK